MALGSEKSWDDWVNEYALAHQHPLNKLCHRIGIPLIVFSLLLVMASGILQSFQLADVSFAWGLALVAFIAGWVFQFVGHYFEKKPPEFLRDWRFLFVGLRWWLRDIRS